MAEVNASSDTKPSNDDNATAVEIEVKIMLDQEIVEQTLDDSSTDNSLMVSATAESISVENADPTQSTLSDESFPRDDESTVDKKIKIAPHTSQSPKVSSKIPDSGSSSQSPSTSKSCEIAVDVPTLTGFESYCSSTSASSTPRDESSSGSPSPIPDDVLGKQISTKPAVNLGKDLSLMMQALNALQSPEEKIAALCKKYADLLDQQKLLQKQLRISQRKQAQVIKEKEQLQSEHTKSLTARSKLESLCRELQRRNRVMKEEQQQKALEEVNLRQEMAAEFQSTLDRIQNQMKTAVDGSNKLQSENERIGGKLNEIVEKYQARETAMENVVKQHNLQEQLVTAQLEKTILEQQEEKEKYAEEKQKLLEQLIERTMMYESKVKQEKELRAQLQYYSEKFEDFQSTLEKSNEVFTSFRSEMDKMSKKLKQAEKYRATIQKKWEDSTKALADTVDYTQQLEVKQARLEKLSRALQAERNELAQRLRQYEENDGKKSKESSRKKKVLEEQTNKDKSRSSNAPVVKHVPAITNELSNKELAAGPKGDPCELKDKVEQENQKDLATLTPPEQDNKKDSSGKTEKAILESSNNDTLGVAVVAS